MVTARRLHTHAPTGPVTLWRVALAGRPSPGAALSRLHGERLPFALTGQWAGGGAVLGSEPIAVAADEEDPFATLDRLPTVAGTGAPASGAVGGGWFGWLGFRLGSRIERLPAGPPRAVAMPEFHLAFYDHVLHLDQAGRWWFEALATSEREAALQSRLRHLRALLTAADSDISHHPAGSLEPMRLSREAAAQHLQAVADGRRRIAAGEIFQANLCLRLQSMTGRSATAVYSDVLRRVAPAYGAAFATPRGGVASLSPELFLRRRGREVVTAPIKGTVPRPSDPARAAAALAALSRSAKDAAEHVMIVDLMRNDLGRVCAYGSIRADPTPGAEAHPGLWHLVSQVRGRLRPEVGDADLLRATFPPGSVTGAPKVQALRVIAALEAASREVYTGAIGYASPVAGLELNVAIRTVELRDGAAWLGAGGGIVADSEPRAELAEALAKARPVADAIGTSVIVGDAR